MNRDGALLEELCPKCEGHASDECSRCSGEIFLRVERVLFDVGPELAAETRERIGCAILDVLARGRVLGSEDHARRLASLLSMTDYVRRTGREQIVATMASYLGRAIAGEVWAAYVAELELVRPPRRREEDAQHFDCAAEE